MKIRPTRKSDIEALQAVEVSASKAFLAIEGLAAFADDNCATEAQHLSAIKPGTSWLAESEDGIPVGFLAAIPEEDVLHICEISVNLDYQKQGIGRSMMAHAEEHAKSRGLAEMTLTTFRHVPWNAPFYKKLGFRILAPEVYGKRLANILEEEISRGVPVPENRCAMRKQLV